jgi:hypothetical protein
LRDVTNFVTLNVAGHQLKVIRRHGRQRVELCVNSFEKLPLIESEQALLVGTPGALCSCMCQSSISLKMGLRFAPVFKMKKMNFRGV